MSGMDIGDQATVRSSAELFAKPQGDTVGLVANPRGDVMCANALPLSTDLVRLGGSWWAKSAASAPVVAVPTTASLFTVYNGNAAGGKSLVIDSVFMNVIVITAAIQGYGIMAALSKVEQAVQAASIVPNGMVAGKVYGGSVTVGTQALDAVSGVITAWMPVGASPSAQNTLQIGTTIECDVRGMLIVPPKHVLALTVLAGAATAASVHVGARWHEMQLALA